MTRTAWLAAIVGALVAGILGTLDVGGSGSAGSAEARARLAAAAVSEARSDTALQSDAGVGYFVVSGDSADQTEGSDALPAARSGSTESAFEVDDIPEGLRERAAADNAVQAEDGWAAAPAGSGLVAVAAPDADGSGLSPIRGLLVALVVFGAVAAAAAAASARKPPTPAPAAGTTPQPAHAQDITPLVEAAAFVRDVVPNESLADRLGAGLAGVGIETIDPTGERFDPDQHHAIEATLPRTPADEGLVARTERVGYRRGTTVVRRPEVVVYRSGA